MHEFVAASVGLHQGFGVVSNYFFLFFDNYFFLFFDLLIIFRIEGCIEDSGDEMGWSSGGEDFEENPDFAVGVEW